MRLLRHRILVLVALCLVALSFRLNATSGSQHHQSTPHVVVQRQSVDADASEMRWLKAHASRSRTSSYAHPHAHPQPVHKKRHLMVHAEGITPVWIALVRCEAPGRGWRYGAPGVGIDAGYYFEGGPNFTHGTWLSHGGGQFAEHAYDATPSEQIVVARRVLADQGPGAWPRCGPRVGLRRGM